MRSSSRLNQIQRPLLIALPCVLAAAWSCWPMLTANHSLALPPQVEELTVGSTQRLVVATSTYLLQTLGFPAVSEETVIIVGDARVVMSDDFFGVRMLLGFMAIAGASSVLIRRPVWERALIAASGLPIALVANVVRVTSTAIVMEGLGETVLSRLLIATSGWLMFPTAVVVLCGELWILSRLLIPPPDRGVVPVGSRRGLSRPIERRCSISERQESLSRAQQSHRFDDQNALHAPTACG